MPNFKLHGLGGNTIEVITLREWVLSVICRVVQELRLRDDAVITLFSSQVFQAVPGLPQAKPYLEIFCPEPIDLGHILLALKMNNLRLDTEVPALNKFFSASEMGRPLDDDGGDEIDGPKKNPQLSLLDPSARQMSDHLDDDGGDEIDGPEEGSSLSGAGEFDF
ncbi:MAG: hypothetical protein WCV71_04210 [Patescibacteria group bacterium]